MLRILQAGKLLEKNGQKRALFQPKIIGGKRALFLAKKLAKVEFFKKKNGHLKDFFSLHSWEYLQCFLWSIFKEDYLSQGQGNLLN